MENQQGILMNNARVNKQHMAELQSYLGSVMQIFGQHGGKPVGQYKTADMLLGENAPEMTALIAFDSAQTIRDMVKGDAFMALADQRARVFSQLDMLICENM